MIFSIGNLITDKCCEGFDWEIVHIFPDNVEGYVSYWGICQNPDCPNFQDNIGPDDPYRGVSQILHEDLLELLENGQRIHR